MHPARRLMNTASVSSSLRIRSLGSRLDPENRTGTLNETENFSFAGSPEVCGGPLCFLGVLR